MILPIVSQGVLLAFFLPTLRDGVIDRLAYSDPIFLRADRVDRGIDRLQDGLGVAYRLRALDRKSVV